MKICQNCNTDQIQRIRDGDFKVLCRCRVCGYMMYDSLSVEEDKRREHFMRFWRKYIRI